MSPAMLEAITQTVRAALAGGVPPNGRHVYTGDVFAFAETDVAGLRETLYEPALCLVLQGEKRTLIDGRALTLAVGDAVIVSHHVPVQAEVTKADAQEPYIALIVKLDMATIRDLTAAIEKLTGPTAESYAVASEPADERLLESVERLLRVLSDPVESALMADAAMREVHLRLLQARHGGMLRDLAAGDAVANGIARAIAFIRERFAQTLSVGEIAKEAGMSESALHEKFRAVTGTTPNQYLKALRLQEAHSLLTVRGLTVTNAALAVGYKSVNQFSRDFAKRFGVPPKEAKASAA
ncbi:MAG: AraC family transcriptional regulator N-terminal domain-containing protein [Parvularculaceae bacterium]